MFNEIKRSRLRRLAQEEHWLGQLREEFGGLEYIQTMAGFVADTLAMILEARRDGTGTTQLERFSQLNRLIKNYVVEIPSEAYRLKRFWAGLIFGLTCEDLLGTRELFLADVGTREFSDGIETEVLLYKIVVEGTEETRERRKGCLTEKMDKLAESEEIHLQRFALGLKQGLVTKGLV